MPVQICLVEESKACETGQVIFMWGFHWWWSSNHNDFSFFLLQYINVVAKVSFIPQLCQELFLFFWLFWKAHELFHFFFMAVHSFNVAINPCFRFSWFITEDAVLFFVVLFASFSISYLGNRYFSCIASGFGLLWMVTKIVIFWRSLTFGRSFFNAVISFWNILLIIWIK